MRYGSPLGSGLGDVDNCVAYVIVSRASAGLQVAFRAVTGRGNAYFQIYRNSKLCGVVYAPEGQEVAATIQSQPGAAAQQVTVLRVGQLSDARADYARVARTFEASTAKQITLQWTWKPEIIGAIDDGGFTSGWTISGMTYTRGSPVAQKPTWTYLTVELVIVAGVLGVNLYNGNVLVMAGAAPVSSLPGAVTLDEVSGSGLSGTVTVSASVAEIEDAKLLFRWPAAKEILRDLSDPPTVAVAQAGFNNADTCIWTEPAALAANTYYYRTRDLSDTGITGTVSATQSFVVNGPPLPPLNLHYNSGNAGNTVVLFTGNSSATGGYHVWVAPEGTPMNMALPWGTVAPGGGGWALPSLAYPGIYRVLVRSVTSGGVEENIGATLTLEYDAAGNYVAPRPNAPSINALTLAVAALTLNVRGLYNAENQKGVATQLQLFSRALGGSYDFNTPDDTVDLTLLRAGCYYADFSTAYGSAGLRYICMKAVTAAGVQGGASEEVLVELNDAALAAPVDVEGWVARG